MYPILIHLGWGARIWGAPFGVWGFLLKSIADPKAWYAPGEGTHDVFLFEIWRGVPPQDSYQMQLTQCTAVTCGYVPIAAGFRSWTHSDLFFLFAQNRR